MAINPSEWQWFGHAGHFICGQWCRFHLCTKVGEYLVSTVGLYVPPHKTGGSERTEAEWLADNPDGADIGCDRKYETRVFGAGEPCTSSDCNCGLPTTVHPELDVFPANKAGDARANHMTLCKKYAAMEKTGEAVSPAKEIRPTRSEEDGGLQVDGE